MNNAFNKLIAIFSGLSGGLLKFAGKINFITFHSFFNDLDYAKVFESVTIAFLCGAAGYAGKKIIDLIIFVLKPIIYGKNYKHTRD
jgi:hypothetical protein